MTIKINKELIKVVVTAIIVMIVFMLLSSLIKTPATGTGTSINLVSIFLTGLLTGGLTCLAVQGGLLAATLAQREQERLQDKAEKTGNAVPILSFLMTKLLAYTLFGMLLGWVGSLFTLSLYTMGLLQMIVAIFMIGTGLNMLNAHPIFRYFVFQPPRFLTKFVRKQSKSKDLFAPALLGALTVFIPCGTTQAMMALAIASGSPWMGTLVMFAFVLGTSPVFFILGYFTTRLTESLHEKFLRFAAVMIILLSLFTMNNAFSLMGSTFTINNLLASRSSETTQKAVNNATITIDNEGYTPKEITVQAGTKVTLHLTNTEGYGCQQAFSIPRLGVQKIVRPGESADITFTAPSKGDLAYTCSMGMFTGVIHSI